MFLLKTLKEIIKIFNTDISPNQIAWGFALGAVLGLVPNLLFKCVLFVVILLFKVNIGAAFIGCGIYAVLSLMLDPLFDKIGFFVLTDINFLKPFYTQLYNLPVVPFTKFNNTVVMGSFIAGIILIIPNMLVAKKGLIFYRTHCKEKVAKWRITKIITALTGAASITKIVK